MRLYIGLLLGLLPTEWIACGPAFSRRTTTRVTTAGLAI